MPEQKTINLDLWGNRDIFEEINLQTDNFIQIFSELSNGISLAKLKSIHPDSKGTKISKGNQLSHCPYQVLDIVRDFHSDTGFNIRLLNWFGHGMFVFIHYAPETALRFEKTIEQISAEFYLGRTSNPWDYSKLIMRPTTEKGLIIPSHLAEFNHLQLFISIKIEECPQKTLSILRNVVGTLFDYHSG